MPDILAHLICADESLKQLSDDMKAIIIANKQVFNLGAQGPDLFFYYKPQPWLDSKNMDDNGNMIHTEHINEFFIQGAKRIKHAIHTDPIGFFRNQNRTSAIHKEFAYLAGFLSHYALDTIGHPYIFYFSGIDSGYNHKYFECVIDTLMTDLYDSKQNSLHKTGKAVALTKRESKIVSLYLSKTIHDTFNKKIVENEIARCIHDMSQTLKALYDPLNLKKSPLSLIDKLSKAEGKIVTATFPAKMEKDIDYLNIAKKQWVHPCDDTIVYEESFLDLFKKATFYSTELIQGLGYYLINNSTQETFESLIGNKQYDTGLTEDKDMVHESIILDFKKTYKIK